MNYPTEKEKKFCVLGLPVDEGGCGWMRVRGPLAKLSQLGLADTDVLPSGQMEESDLKKIISRADILIAKMGSQKLMKWIKERFPYKKIIVDMDDDLFNILPSSAHYDKLGTEDVIVNINGKDIVLWKDGVNFDRFENMKRLVDLRWMLDKADAIVCVTDRLGKWISEVTGKNVVVIPNAIDFDLYPDVEVKAKDKADGEFRIGWCGGASHSADLQMIKGEMLKLLKRNPNVKFHIIGQKFNTFDEAGEQVVKHGWLPFQANPFRLKMLDLDLLLAPLEDTVFNIRKDPLKFWDASGLGVPLLASNIPPFSDVIKDSETGFLFDDPKEMSKKIVRLIKDRELGYRVGKKAREYVFEMHNLEKLAPDILDFYKQVWEQKKS